MECICCLEPWGTRLECCPDKLVCGNCLKENREIKCPDCGSLSLPSEDNSFREYLTQKFHKLISKIEQLEDIYDQVIRDQKQYIQDRPISSEIRKVHVNFKEVELALETNSSFRTQLESMRKVLSLSIPETYPKIKTRIKNFPDRPVIVDLLPIRVRESSILSEDETQWLTFVIQQDLISRYIRLQNKQPNRILKFPEIPFQFTSQDTYCLVEVREEYYYIGIKSPKRMFIWDFQTGKMIFNYEEKHEASLFNGRWVALMIKEYIWFKKIKEGPLVKINFPGIGNSWSLFQDYIVFVSNGNMIKVCLNNPNSFLIIDTGLTNVFGNFGFRFHDKTTELIYYSSNKSYSNQFPDSKITLISDYSVLLIHSRKIWIDNDILEFSPELAQTVSKYHYLNSRGEIVVLYRENKKFVLKFY